MDTNMVEREADATSHRDRPTWRVLGIGALAGLVAGLFLTVLQALARLWAGVAPPSELIGDRIAPLLPVEQFLALLGFFGGYDQLKQVGIVGPSATGFPRGSSCPACSARRTSSGSPGSTL